MYAFWKHKVSQAAVAIAGLPAYQVALWPDGWVLADDGSVLVRDTHRMAEARRWYRHVEAHRCGEATRRAMAMHGVFVPREVVGLAEHRFPSEAVASVALQLVAGDWIASRRRELAANPAAALAERRLAWSGSRHRSAVDVATVRSIVEGVIAQCIAERLVPAAIGRLEVVRDDGYGVCRYRCILSVATDDRTSPDIAGALAVGLIPWNRAVVRDGTTIASIDVQVKPQKGCGWATNKQQFKPV